MSEHERTISVRVPAAEAFRYVSGVSNLPDFVPYLREIREEEDDHVFGIADFGEGRRAEVSGFFRVDEANLTVAWESDGTPGYSGRLQITPETGDQSRITVHISMRSAAGETPPPQPGLASERVERTFDEVMRKLQSVVESNATASRTTF